MDFNLKDYLTVTFTLFAVIDIIGTIPVLISLKSKLGGIREVTVTLISGALMIFFLYIGKPFLNLLGIGLRDFFIRHFQRFITGQFFAQRLIFKGGV